MRPNYLVSLFIGIFLIYFSIYGLAGLGMNFTGAATLPVKEDFTTFTASGGTLDWWLGAGSTSLRAVLDTSFPGAIPSGSSVMLQAGPGNVWGNGEADTWMVNTAVAVGALGQSNVTTYTVTWRIAGNWTSGSGGVADLSIVPGNSLRWEFQVNSTYVSNGGSSASAWSSPVVEDQNWHVYVFCCTKGSPESVDVYRDSVKLGTFQGGTSSAWNSQIEIDSFFGGLTLHVDYIYFDAGLNPPGPSTGLLTVNTQAGGQPLSGIAVSADSVADQTTVAGSTIFTLPVGSLTVSVPATYQSYAFTSWSDGGARSHSITLTAGGLTLTATYTVAATYSLTIYAMSGGSNIDGMSVTVTNGGTPTTKVVTTSGTPFGPYNSASTSAVIDMTYGSYTFAQWSGDGTSNTRGPENLNAGSNSWMATYTQTQANTYSLTIIAQCNGVNIGGMNAVVNTVSKQITTSGTQWGPYTSNAVTASIDASSGSYTFSYWSVNGVNVGTSAPTTLANVGMNTWTAIYTQGGAVTYSLTITARVDSAGGSAISGMNAMINSETKPVASSGTTWGPYSNPSITGCTIDATFSSYTFSYWSVNGMNMGSFPPTTLTAGSNSWIAVYTGSSQPFPDILAQIWAWIQANIINNSTAKQAELYLGGLITLVSIIGFFWPGKKPFIVQLPQGFGGS